MKIFVCKICNEIYIGKIIPPSCPFCGVNQKHLALPHVWEDKNDVTLNGLDKSNVEEALKLELSNTAFYKHASETLNEKTLAIMFKGLFKVEREHASVFKKLLKTESDESPQEDYPSTEKECLEESKLREEGAVAFYAKAMNEAKNERVKEVFEAIMNAEKDHIELDTEMLEKVDQINS